MRSGFRGGGEFATFCCVTDSISDQGVSGQPLGGENGGPGRLVEGPSEGPDPAIGAGITLLGIFLMGTGGARDAHYVFDAGVVTGVLGAGLFVLFVALSVMKQRRTRESD
jgi:hypothetical protein